MEAQGELLQRWPFIGRGEQLSAAVDIICGDGQSVLLSGSPGVGKSRLAREVVRAIGTRGWFADWMLATRSFSTVSFGAALRLLPSGPLPRDAGAVIRLAAAHLAERAGGQPILLAVDDAHLLDGLSAALVHHLVSIGSARVLLTARSGDPWPDAIVALMGDTEASVRIDLSTLTSGAVAELLDRVLGGQVAEESVARLWAVCEGNLVYLRELLTDARAAGALVSSEGLWRWDGGVGTPVRLLEVLGGRLGGLEPGAEEALELVALSEPVLADVVLDAAQRLSGVSRPDVVALLTELERRSLLELTASAGRTFLELAHPLYGELLRSRVTSLRQARLATALADSLEARGGTDERDRLRLATWRITAGDIADEVAAEAATLANRVGDHRAAEQFARASLDQRSSLPASLQLAAALSGQSRLVEAAGVLAAIEGQEPDDRTRMAATYLRVRVLFYGLGDLDGALRAFEQAATAVEGPPAAARLTALRALVLAHACRFEEAADARRSLGDDLTPGVAAALAAATVPATLAEGVLDHATSLIEQAEDRPGRPDEGERRPGSVIFRGALAVTVLLASGQLRSAEGEVAAMEASASGRPEDPDHDSVLAFRGAVALARGRPRQALRSLRDAGPRLRATDAGGFAGWCLALEAQALAYLGEWDTAAETAARAAMLPAAGIQVFEADRQRAAVWAEASPDSRAAAAVRLREQGLRHAERGHWGWALPALHDSLRLHAGQAPVDPDLTTAIEQVALRVEGELAQAIARQAAGLVRSDPDLLWTAAERLELLGADLLAAEALAQCAGAAERASLPARAAAAGRRCARILAGCEGARTPPLVLAEPQARLTTREQQTIELAAAGMSNQEIARRLVTSVRTVEGHLHRAYAKLGISDRRGLAAALGGHSGPSA